MIDMNKLAEELCDMVYDMRMAHMSIVMINEWLNVHGVDLLDVIRLKMEYNRSRPKLHGRLY